MLKILQVRLQQYVNLELTDVQDGCIKGRGTRDRIANIRWIIDVFCTARGFFTAEPPGKPAGNLESSPLSATQEKVARFRDELGS